MLDPLSRYFELSGNERADVLAKLVIQLPPANHNTLPLQDYVPSIRRFIRASWQSRWDQFVADGNKLTQLKPSLGPWSSCSQRNFPCPVSLLVILTLHTVI